MVKILIVFLYTKREDTEALGKQIKNLKGMVDYQTTICLITNLVSQWKDVITIRCPGNINTDFIWDIMRKQISNYTLFYYGLPTYRLEESHLHLYSEYQGIIPLSHRPSLLPYEVDSAGTRHYLMPNHPIPDNNSLGPTNKQLLRKGIQIKQNIPYWKPDFYRKSGTHAFIAPIHPSQGGFLLDKRRLVRILANESPPPIYPYLRLDEAIPGVVPTTRWAEFGIHSIRNRYINGWIDPIFASPDQPPDFTLQDLPSTISELQLRAVVDTVTKGKV